MPSPKGVVAGVPGTPLTPWGSERYLYLWRGYVQNNNHRSWYGAIHEASQHPLDRVNVLVSVNTSIQAPTLFTVSSNLCAIISIASGCVDFSMVATDARGS
jgi:hypothetical protein